MMQSIHMPAFYLGVSDGLFGGSSAGDALHGKGNVNGAILPKLDGQAKWKYAHSDEAFRLTDGTHVFSFKLPTKLPTEDTIVEKLGDISHMDFEHGATEKGTAQIHSSAPDSVHVTLADGRLNPTFRLEHHDGKDWKYIPSKRFIEKLNKAVGDEKPVSLEVNSLLEGGKHEMKKASINIKPSHKGLLHKSLGVSEGTKLTDAQLEAASHSSDVAERRRAQFAINARKWHHKKGMDKEAYMDLGDATSAVMGAGAGLAALAKWKAAHPLTGVAASILGAHALSKAVTGKPPGFLNGVAAPAALSLGTGGLARIMT